MSMSAPTAIRETPGLRSPQADLAAAATVDVAQAIGLARQAQVEWAAQPLTYRLGLVRRFRHLIPDHIAELAAPIHPGRRSLVETLGAEIMPFADSCRFLERNARSILKPYHPGLLSRPAWLFGVRSEVRREPFGVILIIGPGNYPLFLTASQAMQALVAGNAVILKPGVGASGVSHVFASLLARAGFDPRLLRVLPESAEAAKQAIAAGVDKVILTGSARTGAIVLSQLAPQLVPSAMELSGYDAVFVQPGADLDLVARAVGFGFRLNHAETCIAPHRVFVTPELAPELRRRLAALGPEFLTRPSTTASAAQAARLVNDALQKGAELVAGRVLPDNQGITPLVVAKATPDMPLVREESFAPVLSIIEVRNEEEALAAAAQCPFGLGASIFGDEKQALELAGKVRAGGVTINDMIAPTADPRLPFGGRGQSGFGLTRGREGLLEMTTAKVVMVRRGQSHWHLDGPNPEDASLFEAFIRAGHCPRWWQRLGAWARIPRLFVKMMRRPRATPEPTQSVPPGENQ
jgi:acyl-CoA reductase-like NAD-dependent aldehyde dehydrogenase